MLSARRMTLLRLCLIPVGCALGFGWGGQHDRLWWGEPLLGFGVFGAIFLLPFLWRRS
jgi:hypothetical protein